ncbi:MAG: hypothetical protein ACR2KU_00965 [Gammaproteobacteria bacterium]
MRKSRKVLLTTVMLATLGGGPALWAGGANEGMGMMGKDGMPSSQMGNMMPMMRMMRMMGQMNNHTKQMDKIQTMMDKQKTEQAIPNNG